MELAPIGQERTPEIDHDPACPHFCGFGLFGERGRPCLIVSDEYHHRDPAVAALHEVFEDRPDIGPRDRIVAEERLEIDLVYVTRIRCEDGGELVSQFVHHARRGHRANGPTKPSRWNRLSSAAVSASDLSGLEIAPSIRCSHPKSNSRPVPAIRSAAISAALQPQPARSPLVMRK